MAKFDIYRMENGTGYLLDIQADFLNHLSTRVVVPLLPANEAPPPSRWLNPVFQIEDDRFVMATQLLAAVPRSALRTAVRSLSDRRDDIVTAIDFLMQGF